MITTKACAALIAGSIAIAGLAAATADALLADAARQIGDSGPAIAAMRAWKPTGGGAIVLGQGDVVARIGPPQQATVALDSIPPWTIDAFLAAEDKTFWENPGIDTAAIVRAAVRDAINRNRRAAGASTITQQLAKETLLNGYSGSPSRKAMQIVLALRIAATMPKTEALSMHLNRVYLGRDHNGIADASEAWFGKPVQELDIAESATLAGLARNPAAYDPINHPMAAERRRNDVIRSMAADGFLTNQAAAAAIAEPMRTDPRPRRALRLATDRPEGIGWATDLARAQAARGGDIPDGTRLVLTIEPSLQSAAALALETGLMRWDAHQRGWKGKLGHLGTAATTSDAATVQALSKWTTTEICGQNCPSWASPAIITSISATAIGLLGPEGRWIARPSGFDWIGGGSPSIAASRIARGDVVLAGNPLGGPEGGALAQPTDLNGSAVVLSVSDGAILAIAGGKAWAPGGFDRATSAARPPGSAFKPFVYMAALDRGFTPDSTVFDLPISIPDGRSTWSPSNDDGEFEGPIRLADALARSRNPPAARMMWQLGTTTVEDVARAFGIYDRIQNPSAALGTQETTNLALTAAYAAIANGGIRETPHVVAGPTPPPIQVESPDIAGTMGNMLRGVLSEGGTAAALSEFARDMDRAGHIVAGKTGTSSFFRDSWMVGWSGGIAVGVQVGHDEPRPMGNDAFGANVAGPIFAAIMRAANDQGLLKKDVLP